MRASAVLAVAFVVIVPSAASAQSRGLLQSVSVFAIDPSRSSGPLVTIPPVKLQDADDQESDMSEAALRRASERIIDRLRPLEARLRQNDRIRRTGTVVGIGALALGAVRGTAPLTFAGTQALRLGLHAQLDAIERRSGFVVAPSIGHRRVAVTVNRTF